MNQTRAFLIFGWLMVATFLWMEWGREHVPGTDTVVATDTQADATNTAAIPKADATDTGSDTVAAPAVPMAPGNAPVAPPVDADATPVVTVETEVLRVRMRGGEILSTELLRYPQETAAGSPPVQLLSDTAPGIYVARSGWTAPDGNAPSHATGFMPVGDTREYTLAEGQETIEVPFAWTGPDGVTVRRTWTFGANDYAVHVRDEVVNAGAQSWQAHVYRQLLRDAPPDRGSMFTNPEAITFHGAAWYSPEEKYEKRAFADFADDGPLDVQVTGGWVALSQHYFLTAWEPQPDQAALYSLGTNGGLYSIEARGPSFNVAPGQTASTEATLWLGPKLAERLQDVAPGLELALDYGVFTFLAKPIAWLLAKLHLLTSNWGWAIVLLVLIIKLALYPLSAAQYKSAAKMRRFQPRVEQLKERYGDDKQKFQLALMELYKKEKINPVGGCLPVLVQIPVFLALYWVLLESVELRQAAWIPGWIDDLTAQDPYFILPLVNIAVMWATQKLTPTPGMDPMQRKMMQFMPLVFGVMMVFFPAGLVLYWVTNGTLGLAQQWWNIKRYGDQPAPAKG
ncbi:MAG TPA: membrane protein insertase YidC [Xanthomonadaceae bacterium]|nr:membrane protein insertase YidC [Xanthomonadaceae bacterium]